MARSVEYHRLSAGLPSPRPDWGVIHVGPEFLLRPVPPAPLFVDPLPWPTPPTRFIGWDVRRGVPRYRVKAGRA